MPFALFHCHVEQLRNKKSTKEVLKATGWKRRRKKHCANAIIIIMQMRNKRKVNHFCGCTWIHQQRFIACCVPSQNTWAPPRYFLSNKLCVHVQKEIQTITRQKQEHSKPNFKNYQQIRSSSHRIYLFGQFPIAISSGFVFVLFVDFKYSAAKTNDLELRIQHKSAHFVQSSGIGEQTEMRFTFRICNTFCNQFNTYKKAPANNIDIFDVRRCYAVRVVNFPLL